MGLSAKQAVFYLSLFSALSLPPLAAWTAKAWGASHTSTLLAFFTVLTQPFLPLVGLSMMSDATGIAFFLIALAFMGRGKHTRAGCFAGFALACRPSFIAPVALALLFEWYLKKDARLKLLIASSGTLLVFFGGVFLLEGKAYLIEALRFTEGHFSVWGNTSFEQTFERDSWLEALAKEPVAFASLILLTLMTALAVPTRPKLTPLLIAATTAVLWTLLAQNPENLRHVLLPAILLAVWVVCASDKRAKLALVLIIALQLGLWPQFLIKPVTSSPLKQAAEFLDRQPTGSLVTNRGLSYLRASLPLHRIHDSFFSDSVEVALKSEKHGSFWKLIGSQSLSKVWCSSEKAFAARVPGEKTLSLHTWRR
ncbi:hypothetical protein [Pseudovibrio ascidiaceicola]|uniref:hypothetical protein n=1 Tax=Pseudovibrio ascidiaceicola TaxID=285279 RepID=UPI001AD926F9|nr:hypothetical protein [Pseudovibrio ascidiaceicola]